MCGGVGRAKLLVLRRETTDHVTWMFTLMKGLGFREDCGGMDGVNSIKAQGM